jgi:hypothetical protein
MIDISLCFKQVSLHDDFAQVFRKLKMITIFLQGTKINISHNVYDIMYTIHCFIMETCRFQYYKYRKYIMLTSRIN